MDASASPECPEFVIHPPRSAGRDWYVRRAATGGASALACEPQRNLPSCFYTVQPGHDHFAATPVIALQPRANMSDERRPRSRFDSDEPERPTRSRFDTDRRSRSPSRRESEAHRERSPPAPAVTREDTDSPSSASTKNKAAAAAAAAAARINAQIQAKKGIQHVDVPPIRSVRFHCRTAAGSLLTRFCRRSLLQSSGRRPPRTMKPSPARCTNRTVTTSKTLKSTILEIAIL